MPYLIGPARLARYFYHDCERFLRFQATPARQRADRQHSPITRSLLAAGFDWEEQVVRLLGARAVIPEGTGALRDRSWPAAETLPRLRQLEPGQSLYQGQLTVPPSFYARFGLDPELLHFPDCKPDLLQRTPEGTIRVIDVKATDELKASHKIQVGLYVLILQEHLPEVDAEIGAIWLSGQSEPTPFELKHTLPLLETFLRDRLSAIFLEEPTWHLLYRCEWCDHYRSCRQEAEETGSVSLLPYLTHGGRQFLREEGVNTLAELARYLRERPERLDLCGSLRGRGQRLRHQTQALLDHELHPHGGSSLALPIREHVRIVLSLQKEPVSGSLYALAFLRSQGNSDAFFWSECARSHEETPALRRRFLRALHAELAAVDAYNRGREWSEQLSLQCYVFDGFERDLFEDCLLAALDDPELTELAIELLFHFQSEELARWDEHPRTEVPFPVVALSEVIRDLVALPQPLALQLDESVHALKTWQNFRFETPAPLRFELSNALRQDAILKTWSGEKDYARWIESTLQQRLRATRVLLEGLQERLRPRLFAWAPKFAFVESEPFRHSELSRLAFVVRYECLLGALATRRRRSAPWTERVLQAVSILLQCQGEGRFQVLSTVDASKLSESVMFDRLLVPEGEAGERDQMAYDDFRHRASQWAPGKTSVRLARVRRLHPRPEDGTLEALELEVKQANLHDDFRPGDRVVLHERFQDVNSDKILACLRAIDQRPDSLFLRLVQGELAEELPALEAECPELTPSQRRALAHLGRHRLTLVWGPPGTGKTHFLAHSLRALLERQPLRVAITAFTNTAITHLVDKLRQLAPPCPVLRLAYGQVSPQEAAGERGSVVLGATVYQLQKAHRAGLAPVDLLVIDEGSQLKLGETALAMEVLAPTGRLLIAGDHLQLPPIIAGRYPEEGLQDSVFAYLRRLHGEVQLTENFRMNDRLCAFPARSLYGEDYRPRFPEQRLALEPPAGDDLAAWLLDPDYPLALCLLENVRATVENRIEAELVARLAVDLRARGPWRDDREFWKSGLFVVSPHHLQIRAIRKALAARREWTHPPFVDTVDKMQGQESQAVLVSYGVSDPETALAEAEFLYSLNRLNVSLTRARCKCVVFLPRPLLEPTFDLLANPRAAEGLGLMHGLLEFCRAGEGRRVELDEGAAVLYRV